MFSAFVGYSEYCLKHKALLFGAVLLTNLHDLILFAGCAYDTIRPEYFLKINPIMTQSSTHADTPPKFHTLEEARQWADAHYVGQILRTGEPMRKNDEDIY